MPALVLLDELGAGTDPLEGGALGVAIIEHFRTRGAIVISTTHYEALKTYAATTPGVTAAAFGFTPDTYEPTYHIQYGSPGRSLALEMAGRLGLNAAIIDNARKNLSEREAQLAEHLAKVDTDLRALEHERRLVKREREALGEADSRARVARRRAAAARRDVQAAAQRKARRTPARGARGNRRGRRGPEEAGGGARGAGGAERRDRPSTGDTGRLRGDARAAIDALVDKYRKDRRTGAPPSIPPGARRRRRRSRGARSARPRRRRRATCTIAKRKWKCAASASARTRASCACSAARRRSPQPAAVRVNVQLQPREGVSSSELLLVGQHGRSGARSPREVSRREPARRAADGPADSRLRHRPAEGSRRRVSAQASARDERANGVAAGRRRRGDDRGIERLRIGRLADCFQILDFRLQIQVQITPWAFRNPS